MSDKVFFSVITSCYNSKNTLERTFESLKKQEYNSFEWILVDDCSTDNDATRQLIKKIAKEAMFPVKYHFFEQNHFCAKSISKGCELAKGDYVVILDHDDQFTEDVFVRINDILQKYRNVYGVIDIVSIAGRCIDMEGDLIGKKFPRNSFLAYDGEVRYKMGYLNELINFVRKDELEKIAQNMKPGYTFGYFWFTIARNNKFVFTNEVLRIYDTSITTSYTSVTKKTVKYPYNLAEWILLSVDAYEKYLLYRPILVFRQILYHLYLRKKYNLDIAYKGASFKIKSFIFLAMPIAYFRQKFS